VTPNQNNQVNLRWRICSTIVDMDYLIRFVQIHETFRKPEVEALAVLADVNVEFLFYSENVRTKFDSLNSPNLSKQSVASR